MASQFPQSSQPARLCSIGPIPWTHLPSQGGLFVIVDPVELTNAIGTVERKYNFKVLQDPNVLEEIDLTLLANATQRAIEEVQRSTSSGQQPSITIIVKTPCIAMRYPLHDGQVRRFQVRFTSDEDFYETLKVFARVKLPFIEAGSTSNQPHQAVSNEQSTISSTASNVPTTSQNIHPGQSSRTFVNHGGPFHNGPDFAALTMNQPAHAIFAASQQAALVKNTLPNCQQVDTGVPLSGNRGDGQQLTVGVCSSSAPQSWLTPSITTYVPRPSTAPLKNPEQASLDLPPKRDLPFERKKELSARPVSNSHAFSAEAEKDLSASATVVNSTGVTGVPSEVQESGSKTRKRAPAKTKTTKAAKKPKITVSRKNVPNEPVRELPLASSTVSQTIQINHQTLTPPAVQSQLDTQALLDKAASIQAARKARAKNTELQVNTAEGVFNPDPEPGFATVIMSPIVANEITDCTTNVPRKAQALMTAPSSTLLSTDNVILGAEQADQVINKQRAPPSTQTSASAYKNPAFHTDTLATTQTHPEPTKPSAQQPQSSPQKSTSTFTYPNHHPAEPLPNLALLFSTPDFAKPALDPFPSGSSTPSTFDTLPESTRHNLLETWMIQNFEDQGFVNLCKTLDGVWQRVFVQLN